MRQLSETEQAIVLHAARPLDRVGRQGFLDAVSKRLGELPAASLGPGSINRVCRELQRSHFTPPALAGHTPPRRLW